MNNVFFDCKNLKSLNLSNFDTSKAKTMNAMFWGCNNLVSLDISSFDTTSVTNMASMFRGCSSLKSLDLKNFYTPNLKDMNAIFIDCNLLEFVDLSNFDTSQVTDMSAAFQGCNTIESINIENFNTTSLIKMNNMFSNCKKLKSLDIKNFYTPNLEYINDLFSGCDLLESVDISNINTSKVKDMTGVFYCCLTLKSLDIKNFDTSVVTTMEKMFRGCNKLTSLDVSHFKTESVTNMGQMFDQCQYLTSLNLSNFNTNNVNNIFNMFYNCYSLQYLDVSSFNTEKINYMNELFIYTSSLKSLNLSSFIIHDTTTVSFILQGTNANITLCYNASKMPAHFLEQVHSYENSCQKLCIMNSKKYILDKEMCVDNCYNEKEYKYEYDNICFKKCPIRTLLKNDSTYLCEYCPYYFNYEQTKCINIIPEGYYVNDTSIKTIDKCPIKCHTCSFESIINNNNLCISCNINNSYYPKYNDSLNINSFYECYRRDDIEPGYYLDIEENNYKLCYSKCKSCNIGGDDTNNNCIECNDDDNYILENGNCRIKEINSTIISNNELDSSINDYTSYYNINKIYEHIISYDINSNSEAIKINNSLIYIQISQENLYFLKDKFSLKEEDKIFVAIYENTKNDLDTATTDYIYEFYLENFTILNLSIIEEDITVDVYVPIKDLETAKFDLSKEFAEQGYDIYDKNSEFYTDFCTPASFGDNDITLEDRKKDIYPHNATFCKSNCKYSDINREEKRVICSCYLNSDKNITNNEFMEEDDGNFITYLLDNINYKVFQCYKLFFNFNNLKKCYAFYIILVIFAILQIFNFIYMCHTLGKLKKFMEKEFKSNKNLIKNSNKKSKNKANPIRKKREKEEKKN